MTARLALAFAAIAILTIGPALIEGGFLNRWGTPTDLSAAARQVEEFPVEFGAWKLDKNGEPLSAGVCAELGLAGYVSRTYRHRETGSVVSLLLMVGQPGPLLRHPPNICYANRANEQVGATTTFEVQTTTPASQFDLLEYKPPQSLPSDRFLVAFSMATNENWHVPNMPRLEFGASDKLFKVQILSMLDSSQDLKKGTATVQEFARDFCAAFQAMMTHVATNGSQSRGNPVPSGASEASSQTQ